MMRGWSESIRPCDLGSCSTGDVATTVGKDGANICVSPGNA